MPENFSPQPDLMMHLTMLRHQAVVLISLAVCWLGATAVQATYLKDLTLQATTVGAYVPGTLAAVGAAAPWVILVPAIIDAALAAIAYAVTSGTIAYSAVERVKFYSFAKAAGVITFAALILYAFSVLALLYYISLAPAA